jgi:hypothetical protein
VKRIITDPNELASLNAVLLAGLELFIKQVSKGPKK